MAIEPNVFLSDADVLILKQQAYNAGRVLQDYSIIPAILIRDRYFQEKHIEMADVDKYDERNWGGNAYEYALTLCFDAVKKF